MEKNIKKNNNLYLGSDYKIKVNLYELEDLNELKPFQHLQWMLGGYQASPPEYIIDKTRENYKKESDLLQFEERSNLIMYLMYLHKIKRIELSKNRKGEIVKNDTFLLRIENLLEKICICNNDEEFKRVISDYKENEEKLEKIPNNSLIDGVKKLFNQTK